MSDKPELTAYIAWVGALPRHVVKAANEQEAIEAYLHRLGTDEHASNGCILDVGIHEAWVIPPRALPSKVCDITITSEESK